MHNFSAKQCRVLAALHVSSLPPYLSLSPLSFLSSSLSLSLLSLSFCPLSLSLWEVHNSSHKLPDNQLKSQRSWSRQTHWHTHQIKSLTLPASSSPLISSQLSFTSSCGGGGGQITMEGRPLWREDKLCNVWVSAVVATYVRVTLWLLDTPRCGFWRGETKVSTTRDALCTNDSTR